MNHLSETNPTQVLWLIQYNSSHNIQRSVFREINNSK
ncbi:hypothetical protein P3F56_08295 [cyanobacterium endosymbiont of Epithemia clementina EcSB]|nr:hypothetical protein [cyanobacterium endosymbiont of Epithemia clementina EcSB]WGT68516.1 hypothetical protein P3F56_08295 [cyanobacterium endosymbiont of Epithemia clementina EcSB]